MAFPFNENNIADYLNAASSIEIKLLDTPIFRQWIMETSLKHKRDFLLNLKKLKK